MWHLSIFCDYAHNAALAWKLNGQPFLLNVVWTFINCIPLCYQKYKPFQDESIVPLRTYKKNTLCTVYSWRHCCKWGHQWSLLQGFLRCWRIIGWNAQKLTSLLHLQGRLYMSSTTGWRIRLLLNFSLALALLFCISIPRHDMQVTLGETDVFPSLYL